MNQQIDNVRNDLQGKRILLLYARFFGYDQEVKKALENRGAIVDLYDARANINSVEKAIKKITRLFYFKKQQKFHINVMKENNRKNYDFIYTNEHLGEIVLKKYRDFFPNAKLILYLDDSVQNLFHINRTFPLYDRVITFDREDAKKYNIEFRPLFFSEAYDKDSISDVEIKYDVCFIGTCHSDRLKVINEVIAKNDIKNIFLYCYLPSSFMYYYYKLTLPSFKKTNKSFFKYKSIPSSKVVEKMIQSRAILDIQHPKQTGLTMRTIETVGLKKKLITTNEDIRKYDIYNEGNVLVIDRNNPIINESFLTREFQPLSDKQYYYYSINGWIDYIFLNKDGRNSI